MFKTCNHDQEVGTNCIDCIMEKGAERPRRLYYHIFDDNDPEEEMAGILTSAREVGEVLGRLAQDLAEHFFSGKTESLSFQAKNGTKWSKLSDVP